MALTPSTMLALGTQAPDFRLPDTEGNMVALADFEKAQAIVVLFTCNHCPYAVHVAPTFAEVADEYLPKGVQFVAISSNDVDEYPQDSLPKMAEEKTLRGYNFPYLYDETQEVAKAYTAACTPDLFVFDHKQQLVYRGQIDATRPNRISSGNYDSSEEPSTGSDLKAALDAILAGTEVTSEQLPSIGCNIKWKPGNEPNYFG